MEEREDKGAPDKECVAEIIGNRALHEARVKLNLGKILPIRFLHFYANGSLAVATAPLLFAGNHAAVEWREAWGQEQALTAYHWGGGKITALTKLEWDAVQRSVELANRVSQAQQKEPDKRLEALLQALPVAFVRREEFDAAYQSFLLPKEPAGYQVVTGENGESEWEVDFIDRTEERLSLNDSPYIPPELSHVVFQGFEQETCLKNRAEGTTSLTLKQVAYVLKASEDEKAEEAIFCLIEAGKLPPSALFDDANPVPVKIRSYTGEMIDEARGYDYGRNVKTTVEDAEVSGCFGVSGPRGGALKWDSKGRALIGFLDDEHDSNRKLAVVGDWSISKEQLRVSASELESCLLEYLNGDKSLLRASRNRLKQTILPAHPIQPEDSSVSNASGPEPPPSPMPNENPVSAGDPALKKTVGAKAKPGKKEGRPPYADREALEYVFLLCRTSTDSSRREAIAEGNRDKLMDLLHELSGSGDKVKRDEYVAARIAKVYPDRKKKCVVTRAISRKGRLKEPENDLDSDAITKLLDAIKRKYKNFSDNGLSEAFENIKKDSHP